MKKSHAIGIGRQADRWARHGCVNVRSGVLLALGSIVLMQAADASSLREVGYAALPGNAVQITLTADGPISQPTSFATQNPARIAIDLKGVHNALRAPNQTVGIASVRSLDVVESGDRTRVVINLIESVPHSIESQGNRLVLTVNTVPGAPVPRAAGPAPQMAPPTPAQPPQSMPAPAPAATQIPQDSALIGPAPRLAPAPRVTPVAAIEPQPAPAPAAPPPPPPVVEAPPVTIPPPAPIIVAEAPPAAPPASASPASAPAAIPPPQPAQRVAPAAPSFVDLPEPTPAPTPVETASSEPAPAPPTGAAGRVMAVGELPPAEPAAEPAPAIEPASASEPSPRFSGDDFGGPGVRDIDFRRGDGGEGRIIFTLSDPSIVVDVREEVGHVLMDFLKAGSAERLQRKFDVTDFDTPVKMFEVLKKDDGLHVDISSRTEFEYLAYQTEDLFTVEFRPLTSEQKEDLKKKQIGYTGDRLSLNFQDIEVRSVLQLLGDFTGLNMVVSDTVAGNITLRLQNVPWDQALEIILKTKGLAQRQTDNVVMIAPAAELAEMEKKELESRKDKEELAPLNSEFFQLKYAKASDIATLLKNKENLLLTPERGQISFDERTNILLVQDTTFKLEEIQRLLRRLDVAVRQVMIESRVVIASDSFTKDLGIKLGFSRSNVLPSGNTEINIGGGLAGGVDGSSEINDGYFSGGYPDKTGLSQSFQAGYDIGGAEGLMVNLPAAAPLGVMNLLVSKIGSYLLQLELSAMEKEGQGEIVSSPRVVTSDKTKASISQGTEIPYQTVSDAGTKTEFKQAALSLDVTPSILPDDRVMMELVVRKDEPISGYQTSAGIALATRSVQTTVSVDNGDTIVLGGVFERRVNEAVDKLPFFGDLPYVGRAFRREQNNQENNELLVFVTPKILKETVGMR